MFSSTAVRTVQDTRGNLSCTRLFTSTSPTQSSHVFNLIILPGHLGRISPNTIGRRSICIRCWEFAVCKYSSHELASGFAMFCGWWRCLLFELGDSVNVGDQSYSNVLHSELLSVFSFLFVVVLSLSFHVVPGDSDIISCLFSLMAG